MSYQLYDANGFLGDLATTSGMKDLREFLLANGGEEVKSLAVLGSAIVTSDLITELEQLPASADINTRSTLENLVAMVKKSELLVIINAGESDDESS